MFITITNFLLGKVGVSAGLNYWGAYTRVHTRQHISVCWPCLQL